LRHTTIYVEFDPRDKTTVMNLRNEVALAPANMYTITAIVVNIIRLESTLTF